jgi:hypothetical protein
LKKYARITSSKNFIRNARKPNPNRVVVADNTSAIRAEVTAAIASSIKAVTKAEVAVAEIFAEDATLRTRTL